MMGVKHSLSVTGPDMEIQHSEKPGSAKKQTFKAIFTSLALPRCCKRVSIVQFCIEHCQMLRFQYILAL
jgi:hypothetical protein